MFKVILSSFLTALLVLGQAFSYPVFAEEYSISGNGDGSSSEINVKKDEGTTVSQSNEAEVKNEVKPEASTGQNEANNNSGETQVKTGDANQEATVINSGNTNQAQTGCCPTSGGSAEISGNGSGSTNQINSTQGSNTTVSQTNGAMITNNITVSSNTGDNEASDNNGDTTIKTGNIYSSVYAINQGNNSYASVGGGNPELNIKISGNGSGSVNTIEQNHYGDNSFYVNNYIELNNNIYNYSNTGGNKANSNLGKVNILTGDVYLDIILSNKFNTSVVVAECGCKNHPSPTPTPSGSPTPSTPPSGGENGGGGGGSSSGGSGSDSSSGGQGGGLVLGATLPATGGFSIFSLTLFAFALLIAGIMARIDFKKHYETAQNYIEYFNYGFLAPAVIYILAFCKSLSLSRQANFARGQSLYIYPQNISLRPAY